MSDTHRSSRAWHRKKNVNDLIFILTIDGNDNILDTDIGLNKMHY